MNSIDRKARETAQAIFEVVEEELPEWNVSLRHRDDGFAVIQADVAIGKSGVRRFSVQHPFSYRDLFRIPLRAAVDAAIEFTQHCRRELRKAKKNIQEFGV